MAEGINHNNEDEDGCNVQISPFPFAGRRKKERLSPYSFVDEIVENDEEDKRYKVNDD